MESVDQIVLHLHKNKTMTAKALAKAVGLKPISIRYHLTNLMLTKDVMKVNVVHTGHSGRPAYSYKLTAQGRDRAARLEKQVQAGLVRTA